MGRLHVNEALQVPEAHYLYQDYNGDFGGPSGDQYHHFKLYSNQIYRYEGYKADQANRSPVLAGSNNSEAYRFLSQDACRLWNLIPMKERMKIGNVFTHCAISINKKANINAS